MDVPTVILRAGLCLMGDKAFTTISRRLLLKVVSAVVIGLAILPLFFHGSGVRAAVSAGPLEATTTTLSSSANPLVAGNKTTITATVAGAVGGTNGTPTGSVYFYYNAVFLGTSEVSNGQATFEVTLSVGESDFSATYSGDTDYQGSFSEILKQSVVKAATSTLLTLSPSSLDPSTLGQPVTLEATITSEGFPPYGRVDFYDDTTLLGSVSISQAETPQYTVEFTNTTLSVGHHALIARYVASYDQTENSTSPILEQTVSAGSPEKTTTTLSSSANPLISGNKTTIKATVSGANGTPTGTVYFYSNGGFFQSASVSNGQASIEATLSVGNVAFTATYSGDTDYQGSFSAELNQIVNKAPTSTSLTSSLNPSALGQLVTLTASVTSDGYPPYGRVGFYDGATLLGSVAAESHSTVEFATTTLSTDGHSLKAVYTASFDPTKDSTIQTQDSTSPVLTQTISAGPPKVTTTELSSSVNPLISGNKTAITATVGGANGTPTGTVYFYSNGAFLQSASVSSGHASIEAVLSVGNIALTATYSGDTYYQGSFSKPLSQTVITAATSTSLTSSLNPSALGQLVTLTASVTSEGGYPPFGSIGFYEGTTLLRSFETYGLSTIQFTTTTLPIGDHSLRAVYTASSNPNHGSTIQTQDSTSSSLTQTVLTSQQLLNWTQDLSGFVEDTLTLNATATSGLVVTYVSSTPETCSVSGTRLSQISAGPCTVIASQAGNENYNAAPDVQKKFIVGKGSQTITWNQSLVGAVGGSITLTATSSSDLAVSYTGTASVCSVNGSTLRLVGVGTCVVTAEQTGNHNYNAAADVPKTFTVTIGSQTITWSQSLSGSVGDSIALTATASSSLPVSYTGTANICMVSGSTLRLVGAGSCAVTAKQIGNSNYNAATDVPQTFAVAKGSQAIAWNQSLSGSVGGSITLTATASSGLPVSYAGTANICTVNGSTLRLAGAGSCAVTANQTGNVNYNAATDVPQMFAVAKGLQTITWDQSLSGAIGGSLTLTAVASSSLTVSYTGTASICTVSSNILSLIAAGSCVVTARQAGDSDWNAAPDVQKRYTELGPGISISPTSLTFVSQPINTSSAASVVRVTNTGTTNLSVTGVAITGTDASAFTSTNGCTLVAPSSTCTISSTFKPTTIGAKAASLSIASNAPGSPTVISLSGAGGAAAPIISVTPASVSFGNQIINTASATQTLTIKNVGSASMTVSSIAPSGTNAAAFTRAGACTSIAANATCSQTLTFTPTATGPYTATLTINSNAYQSAATPVQLTGTGIVTSISQFVGAVDGPGFANGTGSAARFDSPNGIAIDSSGNIYVTDSKNNLIRKVTSAGAVTTLAGQMLVSGSAVGRGTAARFNGPSGIAIAGTTLYVTDTENHVIRKVTTAGVSSAFVGTVGSSGSTNGTGTAARFNRPQGVVVDSGGNVFITDTDNSTIRKATSAGAVTLFAGTAGSQGGTDGTGTAAHFTKPTGLGRDASNNLFVTDVSGQTVRKITSTAVVTTFAGSNGVSGSNDSNTGASARFSSPSGAVVDPSGDIFISDATNGTVRKVTSAGAVTTVVGTAGSQGSVDGTGAGAMFYRPVGLAADASNNLFVADPVAHAIRKITTSGVVATFAGYSAVVGANDNTGSLAGFRDPSGVIADSGGNLFIADTGNHTIRKVTPTGAVTTFAGLAGSTGTTDATGTSARFSSPSGLAIDRSNNIYVADTGNHTIRKVTSGGVVTTVAGLAGTSGSTDTTGTSARFKSPAALAVTSAGILYVADTGNYTIRKIVLSSGAVTTLAGSAGTTGSTNSATGTAARFGLIYGLGVDTSGNIYASDFSGSTIRKIVPTGTVAVSTFAGTANSRGTTNATGAAARFSSPYGLTVDGLNNIYVSDYANCLLRKITSTAVVTTPIGTAGTCKFIAGNAPSAINAPLGLVKTGTNLFFASGNGVAQVSYVP